MAENYPIEQFFQKVLGQILWNHNIALLTNLKNHQSDNGTYGGSLPTIEEIEAELATTDV